MEPQVMVEDWINAGLVERVGELDREAALLRDERERLLTELVVAKRWVALLAAELERCSAARGVQAAAPTAPLLEQQLQSIIEKPGKNPGIYAL
jgi:hypothetical protein